MRFPISIVVPFEEAALGLRLLRSLQGFLRRQVGLEEARQTLAHRLTNRQADFLALIHRSVYGHPESPYYELLSLAGCEYGDLEKLVQHQGVEGTLQTLFRRGVYITVDEFKGRRPLIRGSATIAVDPTRLHNPDSAFHLLGQSSGSRGPRTVVPVDLAAIRDWAVNFRLFLDARSAGGWHHAVWGVPGGTVLIILLLNSLVGAPPDRWFTQVDPAARSGLHPRYVWSERVLRWGGLLAGIRLPAPAYVPLDDPLPIARWIADVLRSGGVPRLSTFTSSAVRLCQAAAEAGIDLAGAQFTMFGESTTAARLATVRAAGVVATPGYGSMECGIIGYGCLAPTAPDDVHLFHDLHAVIQAGADNTAALPPRTLLMSSLRSTAQFMLLNVSLGDEADLVQRACGCPLERPGWTTHLHTIRSFEKLTAGGMAFLDTDVVRVLEEVLPARFGGGPTHYQLFEEETEGGDSRLRLLVHPAVGPLDSGAVADTFLSSLAAGSETEKVMALQWRGAGFLRVEREAPHTSGGKILHLHHAARSPG